MSFLCIAAFLMVNTDKEINMINQVIGYIQKMFSSNKNEYGSRLEDYILSKHPTSITEIEYYTIQYDRYLQNNSWGFK